MSAPDRENLRALLRDYSALTNGAVVAAPARPAFPAQDSYLDFTARRGAFDRAREKGELQPVFNRAARGTALKNALDWAVENHVKVAVDYNTTENAAGYYAFSGGVCVLARALWADTANTLTHEIRHAWQDMQGLLPVGTPDSFAEGYIRTALVEADAYAWGRLAQHEFCEGPFYDAGARIRLLQDSFAAWYGQHNVWYGERDVTSLAGSCGLGVCLGRPRENYLTAGGFFNKIAHRVLSRPMAERFFDARRDVHPQIPQIDLALEKRRAGGLKNA